MNKVPPEGELSSKIAFVGEAPSYNEVMQGRPFVGLAGQQFNNYLIHSHIVRSECYITNLFPMMVSKSGDKILHEREELYSTRRGFTAEGMKYVRALHDELKQGNFNVVVPLGDPASYALLERKGITKIRGSRYWSTLIDKKVIPCIHPAAALRMYLYRYYIIHDLKVAKEESEYKELVFKQREYHTKDSFEESLSFLHNIGQKKLTPIAFDIEVVNRELSCLSLATQEDFGYVIPFHYKGKPFFTLEQETELIRMIGNILEDNSIKIIGQNLAFDTAFMFNRYGIVTNNIDDTMVAHRIMFPDYPAGLDFITSMYTDIPYYKDEGKQYFKWGGNDDDFLEYNAKDSIVCYEAMPKFRVGLDRMQNLETYEHQVSLIPPITFMGQKGLRVDVEGLEKAKQEAEEQILEYQEELNSIVGAELNPNSSKQVATYFYVHKKLPQYKKDGKMTTNEGAMTRIARKGFKEASLILKIRHLRKMIGTYFDVNLKDGRLVCSYSPITGMGRLSSSQDIFGFGSNMQNQPKSMNKFFLADEGYIIYNIDLSQADNRSVAYIAPEPQMIKAFEEGIDVHSLTASLIFNIPVDEIKQMNKEQVKAPIGYEDQTHRYWGKKANHSLNFGMSFRKFAYTLEIPENEGKDIWNAYHKAYPGIQKSYHKWVRDSLGKDRTLCNAFGRRYRFLNRWDDQLFNQAYAFVPQSNTADIINRWGIEPLYYETSKYQEVVLLRQVHDSINFEIPISIGIDKHVEILKDIKDSLEQSIQWKVYEYKIPSELTGGLNLGDIIDGNEEGQKKLKFDNLKEGLNEYF